MSHNHNHKCTCEHKSVKFCSHCQTVYCESCNQEWSAKANFTYTYSTPWYGGTGYGTNQAIPAAQKSLTLDNQFNDGHEVNCSHGDHV
jgi:hypothetical protein